MLKGVNLKELYDVDEPNRSAATPNPSNENAVYGSDEFRMYAYKIRRCPRTRSHDWTECPYAHRGEKATRRDPRRFSYCAVACPAFRSGSCHRGDACEYAHGVFEYWLHPSRYRTRVCNAGLSCARKVCFFAHTPEQLRLSQARQGSSYWRRLGRDDGGSSGGETSIWAPRKNSQSQNLEKKISMEGEEWYQALLRSWHSLKLRDEKEDSDLDFWHVDWVSKLVD